MKGIVEPAGRLAGAARRSFPGRVLQKVVEDRATSQAVLIAWNGLQSIFPITLGLAAILGLVLGGAGVDSQVVYQTVAAAIPDQAGQQEVLTALRAVRTQTGLFAVLAVVGFLWSASNLIGSMEQAFNPILQAPARGFVRQKLLALLMMLIFSVLIALGILSSTLLALVTRLPWLTLGALARGPGAYLAQFAVGSVAGFLLFFALYYLVPNCRQRVSQVWVGAVFAGVTFEMLTLVFPLYLHLAGPGMNRYGRTFGFLFVLMAFFYFVGLLTMVGIEINAVLDAGPVPQPGRPDAGAPGAPGPGEPPRGLAAQDHAAGPAWRALLAAAAAATALLGLVRRPR
jgi:membrane protein